MPWSDDTSPIAAPIGNIQERPEPEVATSDVIRAAFRSQNTVGSWLSSPSLSGWREADFDALTEIVGTPYEGHATSFVDVRNREDMGKVMRRVDQEQADSDTLARSGGEGVLWQVTAGVLDPVNLIPVGGEVVGAYRAGRIASGIAGGMRAGLIGAAASESALQATQYTRTPLETFENLAGSTVLGGVFGGAGAAIGKMIGSGKLSTTAKTADEAGAAMRDDISARVRGSAEPAPALPVETPESIRIADPNVIAELSPAEIEAAAALRRSLAGESLPYDRDAFAEGTHLGADRIGGYVRDVVKPANGKTSVPRVLFDLVDVPEPVVARAAVINDTFGGTTGRILSVSNQVIDKLYRKNTTEADALLQALPDLLDRGTELLPDHKSVDRLLLARPLDGKNAVAVFEIARGNDGFEVVSIHKSPTRTLDKAREKLREIMGKVLGGKGDSGDGGAAGPSLGGLDAPAAAASVNPDFPTVIATDEANIAIPERSVTPDQSSVGASRAVTTDLAGEGLKSALGIEKVLKFQDPVQRMLSSPAVAARRAVQKLAEIPMTLRKNAEGIATGVEGGAVETRTKAWMGDNYAFERALGAEFVEYRLGRAQKFGDIARLGAADMLRRGDAGPMTFAQFRERVARASRRGDVDPLGDPHVTKAAKAYRGLDEKIKSEALAVGLWKDVPDIGDTAVSHVTRVYDKQRIKAQRPEFVRRVATWLVRQADGPDNLPVPEAMDMAEQITDKVLGTPDGRLPYDIDLAEMAGRAFKGNMRPKESGLFKERTLGIADRDIEEFLENDIAVIARRQIRSMAPDIELARTFGDVAGTLQEKEIVEDFNRMIATAGTEKDRLALGKAKDAALRDFGAMRDILRGTYAMPDDPDAWTVRAARAARQLNAVRLLGGMTISAFSDIGRPVMVHGLGRVFGDGIVPMVRDFRAFRASAEELKTWGIALDMVNNSRQGMIADIMDDYGRHTRLERGLQGLTNANGLLTLMSPWNAAAKQLSGVVTVNRILEACEGVASGRIKPKELERLAAAGIDRDTAEQIAAQFAKHGGAEGGLRIANTGAWDAPRSVVDALKSAVIRDVDRTIVTPGIGDRPLWMSSETGRLIGQFKSFGMASVQRTLISGLQDRDAAALSGAALMVGLGMMTYAVKAKLAGREVADADDMVTWLGEGLDRSGVLGWLMDAYNVPAQAWGAHTSRYASRSVVESLGGPTFGGGLDLASRVAVDAGRGEFDQGTVHALRRLAPYQNLIGISKAFDAAEQGFNETFGVPVR